MCQKLPLFLLGILIALMAGCDSGPRIAPLAPGAVVLAFGDSLTYGTGAGEQESYPKILGKLLNRQVINAGIPGEVSAAGRKRLLNTLARHKPDLIILCHGGNDFLRRLAPDKTRENLSAMIAMARSSGADVVLIGVPKLGWGLSVPEFYQELAKQYALPLEKDILVELLSDNRLKSDTIHPNAAGYQLLAEAVFNLIEKSQ